MSIAVLTDDPRIARIYLEREGVDLDKVWFASRIDMLRGVHHLDAVFVHKASAPLLVEARVRSDRGTKPTRWLDLRQLRTEAPAKPLSR